MDLENTAASVSPQSGAAADSVVESTPRPRRRRKAKIEAETVAASAVEVEAAPTPRADTKPEVKPAGPANATVAPAPATSMAPATPIAPGPRAAARSMSVLPPAAEQRRPAAAKASFVKRHGALAAGMALALGLGAYAGTQLGFERLGDTAAAPEPTVNVAAALPWKRDVAMASTQAREVARLKEELRGVRAQIDVLKSNPDQARQAQELRSLRASIETLKEGLTATRTDTANAIAQVASAQPSKALDRDQQRLDKIVDRLDRLERHLADPTPVAAIPPKSEAPRLAAVPDPHALPTPADIAAAGQKVEIRPKVIPNYVLREVADGVALIEGPDGLREVWPGRGIPGAGKVTAIEKQAGKWVVITSEGLIEYRRDAYLRN